MIELSESKLYEFDEFRLDAKSHRLFRRESGKLVPLTPKAVELLLFLVRNQGRVLSKDELLEAVWDNSFVEESNLSQTIFVLRKALGETTKTPRFILTAPNRGYQFIAAVKEITHADDGVLDSEIVGSEKDFEPAGQRPQFEVQSPKSKAQSRKTTKFIWLGVPLVLLLAFGIYWFYPTAQPAALSEIKSIAVLPFEDLSAGQTEKYLGVSLADALIGKFSGLKRITVRPTGTVLKYTNRRESAQSIGRGLQVEAVLDGRIQRDGERVRVSVQLVRTSDGVTVWAENFDKPFTDFFAVQDSISEKVVSSLAVQLDPIERQRFERRGTENAQAYQEFLLGRFFWNKRTADGLEKAIEHFKQAVELDPNFAQAHSGLAETFVLVNLFGTRHDPNAFPMAKAAAERALQLNDNLAEAHAALAQVKMQYEFDWPGTEQSYRKAIDLNPNSATVRQWYGELLALQGRTAESLSQIEKARELDPTSLSTNNALALPLIRAHETDKALAVTEKVLRMDANFPWALHYRCRAFLQKKDFEKAVEFCEKALAASNQSIYMKANLASAYARAGRETEARRVLAELHTTARTTYVSPFNFAMIYSTLGEKEAALKYLNKAMEERDFLIPTLQGPGDASFFNLKDDPQFLEILRRVNPNRS